jgi:thiamine biosynthesis lipoprotein
VEDPGRIERQVYLMGTLATLVTYDTDRGAGVRRLEEMVRVLEQTEGELSTWRADTLLAELNRQPVGTEWSAPPSLCTLLAEIEFWHRETGGTFDGAIGRLIEAWGLRSGGRRPSAEDLLHALARTGSEYIELDMATCRVTRDRDVIIEEGGFGKGEALDRVARVVGSAPWSIDLGGQVTVHGQPPDSDAWRVGLAHPTKRHDRLLDVELVSGSLATSGGSERDLLVDGMPVGHILDPRTGRPAAFDGSVVVWHERGLVADVLSTALFVMGPEAGLVWAAARNIAACFLIPEEPGGPHEGVEFRMTPNFRRLFDRGREALPSPVRRLARPGSSGGDPLARTVFRVG